MMGHDGPPGAQHRPDARRALARAWADLAQLVAAQVGRLVLAPDGIVATESEPRVSMFDMTAAGWAAEARAAAQPSLVGLGPVGRTDTTTSDVLAWRRARDAGDALVATLAALAVVSAHTVALRGDEAPPGLAGLSSAVLARFPLDTAPADFGPALSGVQEHLVRGADRPGGEP